MPNSYFQFKQFVIHQDGCAMKVTTDSCFFGAWAAKEMQTENDKIENVLDIGTGTCLLPLMIAQKNKVAIETVEIDKNAAQQATENSAVSPWKMQIKIYNENILSFQSKKKYDGIISNPPFYENELKSSQIKKNIAHHSQQLTIEQTISVIQKFLKKEGSFFLMYPFKRAKEVEHILNQKQLFIEKKVILSPSGNHRPFRIIIKGRVLPAITALSAISIWKEQQQYTTEFTELLKDYYLYL